MVLLHSTGLNKFEEWPSELVPVHIYNFCSNSLIILPNVPWINHDLVASAYQKSTNSYTLKLPTVHNSQGGQVLDC